MTALRPGATEPFDASVPGVPVASLDRLPADDHYVQGMLVPYMQFKQSDGHTICAHMESPRLFRRLGSLRTVSAEAEMVRS